MRQDCYKKIAKNEKKLKKILKNDTCTRSVAKVVPWDSTRLAGGMVAYMAGLPFHFLNFFLKSF